MGLNGYKGSTWPQDKIDQLIALHQEGFSAGVIADKMGMTRNAVIGKGWRLGLSFTRETKEFPKPQQPVSQPKVIQLTTKQVETIAARRRQRIIKAMKNQLEHRLTKKLATKPDNEPPVYEPVRLENLTWDAGVPTCCRAIIDGEGSEAIYCGKPVYKRSYCAGHFKKFYYSLSQRGSLATSNLR